MSVLTRRSSRQLFCSCQALSNDGRIYLLETLRRGREGKNERLKWDVEGRWRGEGENKQKDPSRKLEAGDCSKIQELGLIED
jgi:hypothetical protein